MEQSEMELIDHTAAWLKGEDFEMAMLALAGGMVFAVSAAFWLFGTTPAAQAMVLPLLAVGALFVVTGVAGLLGSQGRLDVMSEAWRDDPVAFARAEKARVEGFSALFTGTIIGAALFSAIALGLFVFSENPHLRAIAIVLVLLACAGFTFDFFSKERADRYYGAITGELREHAGVDGSGG